MPVIVTYLVLVLGALGAVAHALLTDPTAATVLTPTVKAVLGVVGIVIAALLPAIQQASKGRSVPPLPALLCLVLLALPGCAWFAANKPALVPVEDALCVFGAEEAGLSPEASATYCKVGIDVVNGLLADKHAKAKAVRSADAGADR